MECPECKDDVQDLCIVVTVYLSVNMEDEEFLDPLHNILLYWNNFQ